MIVYSVTINIEEKEHLDWLSWMKNIHIPDVMNTNCFTEYRLLKVLSRNEGEEGHTYNIQYSCKSNNELNEYQEKYAPTLQKEHTKRFQNKFVAFRTILEKV